MGRRILAVGEINPDIVVRGTRDIHFGQVEDIVEDTSITVGSSVAIMACGAARLGANIRLVGVIGDDYFGEFITAKLRDRDVDVTAVRVVPGTATGSSVILVSAQDRTDRHILTHLGSMAMLSAGDVTDELIGETDHLHVGSWFLHTNARDGLGERLAFARAQGITTSVDPNHDPDLTWDGGLQAALQHVDLLLCNESEACGLAGIDEPEAAARLLLSRLAPVAGRPGLPAVVLKRGALGAVVFYRDVQMYVAAPVVAVADTVGAGDTLTAAVLVELLSDADWKVTLPLGVAAASQSTTRVGGVDGQPTMNQARSLAASLPVTIIQGAS